jgi:DNA-binding transcriptional ArsR family regulator
MQIFRPRTKRSQVALQDNFCMEEKFAETAALLAEPTRAVMMLKLLSGRALPAGELALAANISPQTASGHLAKLLHARLLTVEHQGRHRYYRLSSTEVADALEALLVLVPGTKNERPSRPEVGTIAHARTCYSHLAGWLGVRIADSLQQNGYLRAEKDRAFSITDAGHNWFAQIGISATRGGGKPTLARQCLDWTERRPHLAGPLGVDFYRRLVELNWIVPVARSRTVRVTLRGKKELWNQLRIASG